jgi:hypothetical protein
MHAVASELCKFFSFQKKRDDAIDADFVRHISCQGLARFGLLQCRRHRGPHSSRIACDGRRVRQMCGLPFLAAAAGA